MTCSWTGKRILSADDVHVRNVMSSGRSRGRRRMDCNGKVAVAELLIPITATRPKCRTMRTPSAIDTGPWRGICIRSRRWCVRPNFEMVMLFSSFPPVQRCHTLTVSPSRKGSAWHRTTLVGSGTLPHNHSLRVAIKANAEDWTVTDVRRVARRTDISARTARSMGQSEMCFELRGNDDQVL